MAQYSRACESAVCVRIEPRIG